MSEERGVINVELKKRFENVGSFQTFFCITMAVITLGNKILKWRLQIKIIELAKDGGLRL